MPANPQDLLARAVRHLERATELYPDDAECWSWLGRARLLQADCAHAIQDLNKSFVLHFHPRTAFLLALAHYEIGDIEIAEDFATQALDESSAFARAAAIRAGCRQARGAKKEAIEDLRRACGLTPKVEILGLWLGAWLLESARESSADGKAAALDEAIRWLRTYRFQKFVPGVRYLLTCALLERGFADDALRECSGTDFPSPAENALRRGLSHLMRGDFDRAALAFDDTHADPTFAPLVGPYLKMAREKVRFRLEIDLLPAPQPFALPRLGAASLLGALGGPIRLENSRAITPRSFSIRVTNTTPLPSVKTTTPPSSAPKSEGASES